MRLTLSACAAFMVAVPAFAEMVPPFEGRTIAAISDADMRAYACIDAAIGERRGLDELSIVSLPVTGSQPTGRLEVPNSVINPVYSIAASPDGDTIFVTETHTGQEDGAALISDLQPGTTLRTVDVSDPARPRIIESVEVGNQPLGVSVNPDGRTPVLATETAGSPITFVSFQDGTFGEARQFALDDLSEMPELPDRGQFPHHAEWHPSADVVAVTFNLRNQVRFYRVSRDDAGDVDVIELWGNPIVTTKWPTSGKFSSDGRNFVTNDRKWGPDLGPDRNGTYAPPSQLTSIRLAAREDKAPRHFIAGADPTLVPSRHHVETGPGAHSLIVVND